MMNLGSVHIIADELLFPEGPAFDSKGALWAVEVKGEGIVRYFDGKLTRYHLGGAPNGLSMDSNDHIWFCDSMENAIRKFDPLTGKVQTMVSEVHGRPLNKPNDLVFDARGNLLFTCPGDSKKEPTGYACVRMKDGKVKMIIKDKYFPNGLAFVRSGKEFVIAETYRHRLWKCKWDDEKAQVEELKVWCRIGGPVGPGGPDGMAFHSSGDLYVAVYGTGQIRIVDPSGKWHDHISLPGQNPTNCAFDPTGKLGLIITEAEHGRLLSYPIDK